MERCCHGSTSHEPFICV